jgi:hypothetical protein
VTLRKYFFTSKFSYILFCNPTHKSETGIANSWGTPKSKPNWTNHYDGPIRNTEQQSDHIYYTLFCRCTTLLDLSPATANSGILLSQNHFPETTRHIFTFLHPILLPRITYSAPLEMLLVVLFVFDIPS